MKKILLASILMICPAGHSESYSSDNDKRPLAMEGIEKSDYMNIVKLLTPIALRLEEVQAVKSRGVGVGIILDEDKVGEMEPVIGGLGSGYIINPSYRMSSDAIWNHPDRKPLCLVNIIITSIRPPFSTAYAYIQTNSTKEGTRRINLFAVKTRSGWRQAEESELKDEPKETSRRGHRRAERRAEDVMP